MNMILGKRHIILAALVLSLGIAVYLNWAYSTSAGDFVATDASASGGDSETKNYGDSKYVSANGEDVEVSEASAYFEEARLSRTKSRDEAMDSLKSMFEDVSLSDDQKAELAVQATAMAQAIETEGNLENLIKAKGFEDCMVYLSEDTADVVVKTSGEFTKEDAAQIKDVLLSQTSIPVENISITESK